MLGHPSAGSRLHLKENCENNIFACMHAGASLSWKPVAPGANMRKLMKKYTYMHACMHACWGTPQLEAGNT